VKDIPLIDTARRNKPMRVNGGTFKFKILDANEVPMTSFEEDCFRSMIKNFFSKNTAADVDKFYLQMVSADFAISKKLPCSS
jgi:hypothetical protein